MKFYALFLIVLLSCSQSAGEADVDRQIASSEKINLFSDSSLKSASPVQAVYLENYDHEQKLSTATGFFIAYKSTTYFVTNYHVVSGREPTGSIKDSKGRIPTSIRIFYQTREGTEASLLISTNSEPKWLTYLGSDQSPIDIAVCRLDLPENSNILRNELSFTTSKTGDSCFELGFPKLTLKETGKFKPNKSPAIILDLTEGPLRFANLAAGYPARFHSTVLTNGSSGSPVFNLQNQIIGIHQTKACLSANPDSKNLNDCLGSMFLTTEAIVTAIDSGIPVM